MDLGPHSAFIVAAYAATAAVVVLLMLWIVADYRAQRRMLAKLEQRGVTRRSAAPAQQARATVRREAT